jgi:hypothetical protein
MNGKKKLANIHNPICTYAKMNKTQSLLEENPQPNGHSQINMESNAMKIKFNEKRSK